MDKNNSPLINTSFTNNDLFKLFLENTPASIAMFDREMRYIAYSKRWIRDSKVTDSNLIGKCHYDVVPEIPQRWKDIHKRGLEGEVIESDFDSVVWSDGKIEFNKWKVIPWKDIDGSIGGLILFLEVITELVHFERQLHVNRELLEFALEESNLALFEYSIPENVLTLSPRWVQFMGYDKNHIRWPIEEWNKVIYPDDIENLRKKAKDLIDNQINNFVSEFRIRNSNGFYNWVIVKAKMLVRDSKNNPIRVVGTIFDITEQINKELNKAETNKMEALGRLAGGIAHDFNNLLTVIQGFNKIILDESQNSKVIQNSKKVDESIVKGKNLIDQLLSFSRNQQPVTTKINLNKFILNSFNILKLLLTPEKQIDISLNLDPSDPCFECDMVQFEQVLLNIFSNARDAIQEKGNIIITTSASLENDFFVHSNKIDPKKYLLFSITDTGSGMTTEVLKKVFEPFFTTKEKRKGTGLGTAIIYSIAKNYNWFIDLKSQVGKGTDFRIFIPKSN